MIAAVYARKSTEQNTSDEEKSVTRQIDHARALAARKGWTIADEHVYADDGISGAEFLKREGLTALLSAVRSRPCPVQALITMEVSRLGREQTETAVIVRELMRAGVRLFTYADGREITQDSALDKFSLNALNFVAEMERELSRTRTREAMRSKAARGHVAGGIVFGYRNVRGADHVDRAIIDDQAAVIRRIFQEIAAGRGYAKVAQGLNADAIPCPRGRRWAMTCVREMVFRDLYRGRIVYGRTRWQDRGGTKVKVRVPEAEWLTVDAPHLRVVPEELWRAAHERISRTRQAYLRSTGGKLYGRPETGVESKYLLSGFLVCGACGGGMHVIRRSSQRGRRALYFACNNWRVNHACSNSMSLHTGALDAHVLAALKADVLTPEIVEAVVTRTIELARLEPGEHAERRLRLTSDAERLGEEIGRLTEAVATGAGALPSLVAALKDRERQRADALARLEHLDGLSRAPEWGDGIRSKLRARLTEWHGFLGRQPEVARQILRKLLVGRLVLTPDENTRTYTVQGRATYGRLLEGIIRVGGLVPPG
jgi:DNA invertase Pin-like site-specific DNA recombinase